MKKQLRELIERIRQIDSKAAEYIEGDEIQQVESFTGDANILTELMYWEDTKQGHDYWENINEQLKKGE